MYSVTHVLQVLEMAVALHAVAARHQAVDTTDQAALVHHVVPAHHTLLVAHHQPAVAVAAVLPAAAEVAVLPVAAAVAAVSAAVVVAVVAADDTTAQPCEL